MKILHNISKKEDGFVLVLSLVMLVVLSLFGVFALNTTTFELQIAGNDKIHKETSYKAESGDMVGIELLEQNISCADGFASDADQIPYSNHTIDVRDFNGKVRVHGWTTGVADHAYEGLAFYLNQSVWEDTVCNIVIPDQPNISLPISNISLDITQDTDRTDVYLGGAVKKLPGGALQMAAGYERLGKSSAAGGAVRSYDIIARHRGGSNSESVVAIGWDHLIGTEYAAESNDNCK